MKLDALPLTRDYGDSDAEIHYPCIMTHICAIELDHHWLRYWLSVCYAPIQYMNRSMIIYHQMDPFKRTFNLSIFNESTISFKTTDFSRYLRSCSNYIYALISTCAPVPGNMGICDTVETLYSTIYYSKYFIELNFEKSTQYVALWTHKRHPIPRPFGRAMECLLWVLQQKLTVL